VPWPQRHLHSVLPAGHMRGPPGGHPLGGCARLPFNAPPAPARRWHSAGPPRPTTGP
jgi:hypothetical protein